MAQTGMAKQWWVLGALLVATMGACQFSLSNEYKAAPRSDQDIVEALAQLPEAEVLLYSADDVPQFIVGELGKIDPVQNAGLVLDDRALRIALPPILKVFRLESEDLVLRRVTTDEVGGRHYRYVQKFNGMDVVASELVVHVDFKGVIIGANGTARGDIAHSLGSVAMSESAATLAIENDARWADLTDRTVRPLRTVYVQSAEGTIHKAREQLVIGKRGRDPVEDKVFVDVETGNVVAVHPQIHFARNRNTHNLNHGTLLPGTLECPETPCISNDLDVLGAHNGAGDTYDMYNFYWQRDSYDNNGAILRSSIHYSTNYCNAFWNNVQMVYGDGNGSSCLPLARSIDVAAHELTHAVTSRESNLTYSGESGGLNESLSDVWGAGVEAWVDGGRNGTLSLADDVFLIGDTVLLPFLRSMCDPAADGVSRDEWTSGLGGIDVHYSSGPNNLVFCLLSKGGMHPRGKTTIPVPAIGMEKTLHLMYRVNVDFLTPSSNYAMMRNAMIAAASQLGYVQADQDAVGCAYAAIKVGTAPTSCGGTQPPSGDGVLMNGVPVTGISDSTVGNMRFWSFNVPADQTSLTFTISGGSGDADMYVQFGEKPTTTVYQCRPYLNGNKEICRFTPPSAGTYWVGLRAYSAYSNVTLTGTYSTTGGSDPYLTNGVPVTGISEGTVGNMRFWRLNVPAGQTTLTFTISGGSGNADMYVRFGLMPTTTEHQCRPYLNGNNETCTFSLPSAGTWWIGLRAYSAYSGVTLTGTYSGDLTNGVPVTGISDSSVDNFKFWSFNVPAGQTTLTFTISGGTGDADMYVQFGSMPAATVYQCRPYLNGNNETCTFTLPSAGTWWMGLRVHSAYSGVTLTGTYISGDLTNSVPVTGISDSTIGNMRFWSLNVPAGQTTLTFTISGGTGDADMYVRIGSTPTETIYQCRPYLKGNNETCTFSLPSAGTWWVGLRVYSVYFDVSLIGRYWSCNDGVDNDGDGAIDCADSDCAAALVCTPENCDDGVDNDGDGDNDCGDSDCAPVCTPENCSDGVDNDGDGDNDCGDSDCAPVCL